MHADSSPMKPYYPMDFVEDMNGKRNPWEAVVLLPFIDIERLKAAVTEVENDSSLMASIPATDRERNTFGEVLSYQPQEINQSKNKSQSSLVAALPAVSYVIEKSAPVNSPGVSFSQKMINGTIIPYDGFPSLRSLPINHIFIRLLHHKAMLGMKYKTLILGVSESTLATDEQSLRQILGQHVFVNYPMRHEAKVVGVNTVTSEYSLTESDSSVVITETLRAEEEQEAWQLLAAKCQDHFISGRKDAIGSGSGGLAIGTVNTMLTVVPVLKSVICGSSGERDRQYATSTVAYPAQLVQLPAQSVRRQRADAVSRRRVNSRKGKPALAAPPAPAAVGGAGACAGAGGIRQFSSSSVRMGLRQFSFLLKKIR
jgi:5'-3' exonuclease